VTVPAFERNRLAIERLNRALMDATGGVLQLAASVETDKKFNIVIERVPKYGPPLAVRRMDGLTRQTLDALSVMLEGVAEARFTYTSGARR